MTNANTSSVAKLSVAFVAVAMMLSMVAPAKAATIEELQAMIAQLTAQLSSLSGSTTTSTASYTFTRSLTVGAQGADVTALQNFLIAKGHTIAAGATGYFGAQTASAVAAWQAANGIAPAAGYFGPVSIAKYASMSATGSTTGSTGSTAVTGGAGSATVTNYSSDVEDEVATNDSEKVFGFKVEADDSDVKLTNVKITLDHSNPDGSDIITRYFDSFDVTMNGDVVATVDASDFTRNSAGNYSKNVALKDAIVKEGSSNKGVFYVVAHANDTVDSADEDAEWTISAADFRYTDGTGAILTTDDEDTTETVSVIKLASSGDVKVKLSLATDSPDAATVKVDDDNSGDKVTLLKFRIKAEGTDVSFDEITFTLDDGSGSTTLETVSEFILMKGSDVVETEDDFSATSTTFTLDDEEVIDEDDTVTYTLVAKMNKNTWTNSSLKATLANSGINYMDANGDDITTGLSGSANGDTMTFRGDGVTLAKTSITATDITKTASSTDTEYAKFVVTFKVTADGDDVYVASTTDAIAHTLLGISVAGSALTSTADKAASGNYRVNDGETETFTYTVETVVGTGTYQLVMDTFEFGTTDADVTTGSQAFSPEATWTSDAVILN